MSREPVLRRALAVAVALVAGTGIAAAGLATSPAWAEVATVERAPFATNPVTSQQAGRPGPPPPLDLSEPAAPSIEPGPEEAGVDEAASDPLDEAAPPPPTAPPPPPAPAPATTAPPAPTTTAAPPPAPAPAPAPASAPTATGGPRDADCEASMLAWMREARAGAGAGALVDDAAIDHVALGWSTQLAEAGRLAHNPRYGDQVFAARPEARTSGEVVGRGRDARPVFDEFMRSPTHRDAIVRRAFTHAAVACVRDAGGQVWVTANFWG